MRKLSRKRLEWLHRRNVAENRPVSRQPRNKRNRVKVHRSEIVAPQYFCILPSRFNHNAATIEFLTFLRNVRGFRGSALCIDMSRVQRMVVNATLLFKAEVAYLVQRGVQVSARLPRKPRVHQVLTQTGVAKQLSLPDCAVVDREDTVHWRHASGAWNITQPSRLQTLLGDHVEQTESLYQGMIESVANCIEHAYREHPRRRAFSDSDLGWWGFQQVRDGVLSTCICDLGIGINNSLPLKLADEPGLYASLISLFRHMKGADVRAILAAVEYGRSSTGQVQRGKGLRDAHKVIDEAGEGHFQIFSNRGMYFYSRDKGQKPESGTRKLPESIEGTIYFWSYPLQSSGQDGVTSVQGVQPCQP